jgi:thiol-disulfide isomerase/thioredoxin
MQTEAYDISMDQNEISPTILVYILSTFHIVFIHLYADNYKLFHGRPSVVLDPPYIFSAIWFSSCQSIRLSALIRAAPTGRISVKFRIGDFYENLSRNPSLVDIGQKYRVLYMKNEVRFIVADDIKSPLKHSLRVKWYQAVMIAKEL